ncbi:unnamed protein product [Protopolystoma xenopodis]|uniref:Uncharacterized protein n=1 Tax=Protopolystoma xenopodis TaxID=117903 RepID=A0A448WGF0_9PLAT|nr:unnamed protein product [Protopolystoma xenopodis]
MALLTDVTGETFGNFSSRWSNAGNHEYYGRGHRTLYIPQGRTNTKCWSFCKYEDQDSLASVLATVFFRHAEVIWTFFSQPAHERILSDDEDLETEGKAESRKISRLQSAAKGTSSLMTFFNPTASSDKMLSADRPVNPFRKAAHLFSISDLV